MGRNVPASTGGRERQARQAFLLPVAVFLALVVTACSAKGPAPVEERSWNVLGVVQSYVPGPGFEWSSPAFTTGPPHPELRVGPMELVLSDGRTLDVPASTPGASACVVFMSEADKRASTGLTDQAEIRDEEVAASVGLDGLCRIIAQVRPDNSVERFQVLLPDVDGAADAGWVVEGDATSVMTSLGYRFPVSSAAEVHCSDERTLEEVLAAPGLASASVDMATGQVSAFRCIYRD